MRVDKDLAGVDPAPGKSKKLWLQYAVDGVLGNLVLDDGNELRLPENPVSYLPPAPTLTVTSAGTVLRAWDAGRYVMIPNAGGEEIVRASQTAGTAGGCRPVECLVPNRPRRTGAGASSTKLLSWPEHADAGIRYFSGTATYRRTLDIPAELLGAGQGIASRPGAGPGDGRSAAQRPQPGHPVEGPVSGGSNIRGAGGRKSNWRSRSPICGPTA